jgi:hypothetical protein
MGSSSFNVKDWIEAKAETYDEREVYLDKIKPLMDQVFDLCEQHRIPFNFVAAISDSSEGTSVAQVGIAPGPSRMPMEVMLARSAGTASDDEVFTALFRALELKHLHQMLHAHDDEPAKPNLKLVKFDA